eukprot:scaffold15585_cov162-Skeletonema_menzelii.AAC.11
MPLMSPISTLILIAAFIHSGSAFSTPPRRSNFRGGAVVQSSSSLSENYSSLDVTSPNNKKKSKESSLFTTSTPGPYIRIQKRGRHYDVQTAVTTFRKKIDKTTVELHSQIHFGDESYFNYFNDEGQFGSLYDKVLYELIVDDEFLHTTDNNDATTINNIVRTLLPTRDNLNPIAPTAADRNTASQYGLQCQVDGIQYCRENWIHADLTRQEFLNLLSKQEEEKEEQGGRTQTTSFSNNKQQPLWALASTTATYPGSEAFTALLRPLTTNTNSASVQLTRRLFTHLFLPGDALSGWIRAILWFGVPAPELSILLVDWSSLSYIGRGMRRRQRQGGRDTTAEDKGIAPISPIAAPVLLSLLTGNWGTARRLVFGQVLVGGQSSEDTSKNSVLIEKRNEHAMNVLRETLRLESDGHDSAERQKRIALLYGAGHCRDLHGRLEEEGYVPVRTEWRTAFRADAPKWGDYFNVDRDFSKTNKSAGGITSGTSISTELSQFGEGVISSLSTSALESAAVGLVVLPLYLLIGGLDWVSTLQELGSAFENGQYLDGMASMILYLVRHVALYVGISKFVIDWGGDNGTIVEEEQ